MTAAAIEMPAPPSRFDRNAPAWAEIYRHVSPAEKSRLERRSLLTRKTVRELIEEMLEWLRDAKRKGLIR